MKGNSRLIFVVLGVIVLAGAFWMLLLSPKREEAKRLDKQAQQLQATLAQHESEVETGLAAKREFAANYGQLVVLGKAVPADSETASLLVQIQKISERAGVRFEEISLAAEGGETAAAPTVESSSPTEVAASTMPLGASIGPAGLGVMPYTLNFTGNFFQISRFIHGLDNLVKTTNKKVSVDGRLITVNSFSLSPVEEQGSTDLQAAFSVTTYLTPPEQGVTAGATPVGPATATATATPASATIGETP
ncbi:MAG TPA: type 4a pilus biogenesis protein PilO [Solirubrobacterales bacterium]|jgi:Tfp pilus assembly protein PilO|nr:type 4a pilus biogenesis protein PilO [Solirubrobacterales bacterium]